MAPLESNKFTEILILKQIKKKNKILKTLKILEGIRQKMIILEAAYMLKSGTTTILKRSKSHSGPKSYIQMQEERKARFRYKIKEYIQKTA